MLEICSKLGGKNEDLRQKPSTSAVQGILPTLCSTQNHWRCNAQVISVSVPPLQTCIPMLQNCSQLEEGLKLRAQTEAIHKCCTSSFFFKFSALWQVQTSDGSTSPGFELLP